MSHTFIGDPSVPLEDSVLAGRVGKALVDLLGLEHMPSGYHVLTANGAKTYTGLARAVWEVMEKEITRE